MANLILVLGGQWNFDADNREKWTGKPPAPERRAALLRRAEQLLEQIETL